MKLSYNFLFCSLAVAITLDVITSGIGIFSGAAYEANKVMYFLGNDAYHTMFMIVSLKLISYFVIMLLAIITHKYIDQTTSKIIIILAIIANLIIVINNIYQILR